MERVENWPNALDEWIEWNRNIPFEWGVHDCLLFAASTIKQITGFDPASEYRGTYSTALGAYRIIEDAGGIDQLIESCLPDGTERRTHRNLAGRGDLVTHLDAKGRTAAGIVANGCAVFPGPEKLTFLKIRDCNLRAWRIG